MNKKIFAILFISIFLIASIGFVSAADEGGDKVSNPLKVKIVWNDNGQTSDRPSQVTVSLLKDGTVVESVILKDSNSWSATFKTQNDGGKYKVLVKDDISSYSVSSKGSANAGFVISAVLKEAPLKASGENASLIKASDSGNATGDSDNGTNSTANNTVNNNTNNDTDNANNTTNNTSKNVSNNTKKVQNDTKPVKKEKPHKTKLKNTGIPLAGLCLVSMVVAFIPFRNKK